MKTFDWVMIVVALIYLAVTFGLKITFKPFTITAESWKTGIGWVLLAVGIAVIAVDVNLRGYGEGYQKGLKDGSQMLIDSLQKEIDKMNKAQENPPFKDKITNES